VLVRRGGAELRIADALLFSVAWGGALHWRDARCVAHGPRSVGFAWRGAIDVGSDLLALPAVAFAAVTAVSFAVQVAAAALRGRAVARSHDYREHQAARTIASSGISSPQLPRLMLRMT